MKKTILVAGAFCAFVGFAQAAIIASDNASDAAYADGWQAGDNGGSGFGAWALGPDGAEASMLIGSSADNATGSNSGLTDIDTAGVSWGLKGDQNDVTRDLTGGALSLGQTFSIGFDQGFGANGGAFGFGLRAGTANVFEALVFDGGANGGILNVGGNWVSHGWTDDGYNIAFTVTSATSADVSVTFLDDDSVENLA